ncbi:MAG: hypothetical protein K0M69_02635, partial [Youngiibacter sp.]|nr:hypothetical protein [Youngiibacter sp.]
MDLIKAFIYDTIYVLLNYIVANIPSWNIRKLFYIVFGMKIHKKARIHMKCTVIMPWKIEIGENSIVNEHCYLDGRGGLFIGNNASISIYTIILTASHDSRSGNFSYYKSPVVIKDNVWIGARSIIMENSSVEELCI